MDTLITINTFHNMHPSLRSFMEHVSQKCRKIPQALRAVFYKYCLKLFIEKKSKILKLGQNVQRSSGTIPRKNNLRSIRFFFQANGFDDGLTALRSAFRNTLLKTRPRINKKVQLQTIIDCEQSVFSPQIFGVSGNVIIMQIR